MVNLIKKIADMSDNQIRNEVSKQIARGSVGKTQLENIIRYLEENDPNIFNSEKKGFIQNDNRNQWNKEYLQKIHNAVICGYFCRSILFHMHSVVSKLSLKYKLAAIGIGVALFGLFLFLISLVVDA